MQTQIRSIIYNHNKNILAIPVYHYLTAQNEPQSIETEVLGPIVIGKLKECLQEYEKLHELSKGMIKISSEPAILKPLYEQADHATQYWTALYHKLYRKQSENTMLDAKIVKIGLPMKKVLYSFGIEPKRNLIKCIAHNDSNPSAHVYKNSIHCFSCGYHGDVIDVAMRLGNLDFPSALRRLAELK